MQYSECVEKSFIIDVGRMIFRSSLIFYVYGNYF